MGAVNTTYTFAATDSITSTKMNNIIDETTMTGDAILGTTLEVASGKLKVRSQGITSNELASNAVTSTQITDGAVTSGKLSTGGPTWTLGGIGITYLNTGAIEINNDIAIDTDCYIDFHSSPSVDSSTRIIRGSGVNGVLTIQQIGTGNFVLASPNSQLVFSGPNGFQMYNGSSSSNFPVPAGTAPIYGARAWVNFDATRNAAGGTDALMTDRFIRNSANVQKVTKTATGMFDVYFTTAIPANYCVSGSYNENGTNTAGTSNGTLNGYYNTTAIAKVSCTGFGSSGTNAAHVAAVFFA